MENVYVVKGGRRLSGEIKVSGAKNAALKVMIASLFFDEPVQIENVPDINDVHEVVHIIKELGGSADRIDKNIYRISGKNLEKNKISLLHAGKVRVSFMFLAPLLFRFEECFIPNPGGCRIGARPIDRIIRGLRSLGVEAEYDSSTGYYRFSRRGKIGGFYRFEKPSHTGTETLIMLAAFADSDVVLEGTALEPEIDDLIKVFASSGVWIKRSKEDPTRIHISNAQKKFKTNLKIVLSGDRNEAVSYAVLGVLLGEKINVKGVKVERYSRFLQKLRQAGGRFRELSEDTVVFENSADLVPVDIQTQPFPGFMTDWQPLWAVLMTQAQGVSHITEWVFENRFGYVPELRKLGADIDFIKTKRQDYEKFHFNLQPDKEYYQTIRIKGKTDFHNGVLKVSDLRAGATLVIASLLAKGESVIEGADIIERGYEDFVQRLSSLGADIIKK